MRFRFIDRWILAAAVVCCGFQTQPIYAQAVSYHTTSVGGIRIFYRQAGDPDKPTILLLHGFPTSSHMFRDLMPRLASDFFVLAPDYPGMGYSEAPTRDRFAPTDDSLADVIEKFARQLAPRPFIIYMQDLGGPVGMRLATRHPDWIGGLIFQNTPISTADWEPTRLKSIQPDDGPVTAVQQAAAESRVSLDTARFLYQHGARSPDALNPDAWTTDAYALNQPENRRIMVGYLLDGRSNLRLYPAWHEYLRHSHPRTLVVWGRNDPIFLEIGASDIKHEVPAADVHLYDTGHFALEEDSEDIARQIKNWFRHP
jgi:pimeloyl-ACP methyl ester carboxylesterase